MFFLAISMPAAASSIIVIRTLEDASDIDQIVRSSFIRDTGGGTLTDV
jgi:hypothetical protein